MEDGMIPGELVLGEYSMIQPLMNLQFFCPTEEVPIQGGLSAKVKFLLGSLMIEAAAQVY
jgi:hypothetical protein